MLHNLSPILFSFILFTFYLSSVLCLLVAKRRPRRSPLGEAGRPLSSVFKSAIRNLKYAIKTVLCHPSSVLCPPPASAKRSEDGSAHRRTIALKLYQTQFYSQQIYNYINKYIYIPRISLSLMRLRTYYFAYNRFLNGILKGICSSFVQGTVIELIFQPYYAIQQGHWLRNIRTIHRRLICQKTPCVRRGLSPFQ